MATGGDDATVRVYELASGAVAKTVPAQGDAVNGVSFHPHRPLLALSTGTRHFARESAGGSSSDSDSDEGEGGGGGRGGGQGEVKDGDGDGDGGGGGDSGVEPLFCVRVVSFGDIHIQGDSQGTLGDPQDAGSSAVTAMATTATGAAAVEAADSANDNDNDNDPANAAPSGSAADENDGGGGDDGNGDGDGTAAGSAEGSSDVADGGQEVVVSVKSGRVVLTATPSKRGGPASSTPTTDMEVEVSGEGGAAASTASASAVSLSLTPEAWANLKAKVDAELGAGV